MITAILNSGFGHSVRFIALVENMRKYSDPEISCLAPECMKKFLKLNIAQYNCNIHNAYYYQSLINKKTGSIKKTLKYKDKKNFQRLRNTSVIINDFTPAIDDFLKFFPDKAITCCLYHGDIDINNSDNRKITDFKSTIINTANKHNFFFHINLNQPKKNTHLKCNYIPIPIVSRAVTLDKRAVNEMLGLSPDEKFVLIHAGSAVMENVYKDLHIFYTAVNRLDLPYKIVISSSLENNEFSFHKEIIKAPLFLNGLNLVNASELVVSKPGMGILQDCIVAKKPLLFLPGDFPERNMKIKLLNDLLSGNLPLMKKITTEALDKCINQCLSLASTYHKAYEQIPINGADILARAVTILKDCKRNNLYDSIAKIRQMSPFSVE